jgi:hypothetical protein
MTPSSYSTGHHPLGHTGILSAVSSLSCTSHVMAGRSGVERPRDPTGRSASPQAQNRQPPPPIAALQEVKHDREQRRLQACRHRGAYDRGRGTLNHWWSGWMLHRHLPEPCSMLGHPARWPRPCDAPAELHRGPQARGHTVTLQPRRALWRWRRVAAGRHQPAARPHRAVSDPASAPAQRRRSRRPTAPP